MTSIGCRKAAEYSRALHEIAGNARARREWLWLSAREKDDDATAADLENIDPQLRQRMAVHEAAVNALGDPAARRQAWGRLLEERMPCTEVVWCDCARCGA